MSVFCPTLRNKEIDNIAHVGSWPVPVSPSTQIDCAVDHFKRLEPLSQGWTFLLEHGKALAERFGVRPEELVLGMFRPHRGLPPRKF